MQKLLSLGIVIFSVFILFTGGVHASNEKYLVNYLTVKDGLSQNEVTTIIKDKYGVLWFGTRGGLNSYDGYEFVHFKPGNDKNNGFRNPSIERLLLDKRGNILIGTKSGGITLYKAVEDTFIHISDTLNILPKRCISFCEDSNGDIWFGSWQNGVWKYSFDNKTFTHFLGQEKVNSIVQTRDGTIWCGTSNGLRYKTDNGQFEKFSFGIKSIEITKIVKDTHEQVLWIVGWGLDLIKFNYKDFAFEQFKLPIKNREVPAYAYSLLADNENKVWVGTWGNGLFLFDKQKKVFNKIEIKPEYLDDNIRTDYDVILDIYQDNEGIIWLGTDGGGIVKLLKKNNFKVIHSFDGKKFTKQHVSSILVDSNNDLWIGTKGEGLFYTHDRKKISKVYFNKRCGLSDSSFLVVKYLYQDSLNNVWVSFNEGVFVVKKRKYRSELEKASEYFNSPDLNIIKKGHHLVWRKDGLWIGTQQDGMYYFKYELGKFNLKKHFSKSNGVKDIKSNRISTFISDNNGDFWIGTYDGIFKYDKIDSSFLSLDSILHTNNAALCNIILTMHVDSRNCLWFGTPCCLCKLTKGQFGNYVLKRYTKQNGLPNDYINGILSDRKGNIWVSTNAGISKLDDETGDIRNYYENDGVGDSNFSEASCFRDKYGKLYFGGYTGLTYFDPDSIKDNSIVPNIVITNFKVLNKTVPVKPEGLLPVNINEIKKLTLTYKDKEFSFEFAALDYRAPLRIRYAYMLEGFNDEWVYTGERRHISFSNLSHGKYVLHLKSTNSRGDWNSSIKNLSIEILPPPWKTWYALVIYILLAIGLTSIVRWNAVKQERLQQRVEMEKLVREKEHDVSEMKLRFFTNVSHEFRTPLTLIVALIKDLKKDTEKLSGDIVRKINVIYNNAERLMKLIDQLMEFRKMESGTTKLDLSYSDIYTFLYKISYPFQEIAEVNDITFKINIELKNKYCLFDPDKIEVVLNNLLSNAFKFTSKNGIVILSCRDTEEQIVISVEDNGIGISAEEQMNIFERFYQTDDGKGERGTGIGLALSKKIIEMHKGLISVKSERNKGTVFTVIIPRGNKKEISKYIEVSKPFDVLPATSRKKMNFEVKIQQDKSKKVLVVEDNKEVCMYLEELLSKYFTVTIAFDGLLGYELAKKELPDIIVSDVMMPGMDGYELCNSLKSNERTNTIPVILLTAKTAEQFKVFGITKGADAYISKPFDPDLLLATINNFLKSVKRVEKKYSKKIFIDPKNVEITSSEEKLINKINEFLEINLSDPEFDTRKLAENLCMSQATLYRKLKPVVGITPAEYIRTFRIKRAANLLADHDKTVTEIAFEVGFLDIKSFRSAFVKHFGKTPSKYREEV